MNNSSFKKHLIALGSATSFTDSLYKKLQLEEYDYTRIIQSEHTGPLEDEYYSYGIQQRKVSDNYFDKPYLEHSESDEILDMFKSRLVEADLVIFISVLCDRMSPDILLAGMLAVQDSGCRCLAILLEPPVWFKKEYHSSYKKVITSLKHGMRNVITIESASVCKKPEIGITVENFIHLKQISRDLLLTLAQRGLICVDWADIYHLLGPNKKIITFISHGRGDNDVIEAIKNMVKKVNRNLEFTKEHGSVYIGIASGKNNNFHKTMKSIRKEVNQIPGINDFDLIIKYLPQGNWTGRTELTMIFSI